MVKLYTLLERTLQPPPLQLQPLTPQNDEVNVLESFYVGKNSKFITVEMELKHEFQHHKDKKFSISPKTLS